MKTPRLGWYGDDFTGATDTLAVLAQAGLRAMLFLGVPDTRQLERATEMLGGPLDAVGIAGAARAMSPDQMARELAPVGAFFAKLAVPMLHYKVCSTFDSAPLVGSIGAAVRALRPHVEDGRVFIVGGQPSLGRYCAFSNLFAAAGRDGLVERIDRHPTMKCHPTTPMQEGDLRRHLALQGLEPVAALHYPVYALPPKQQDESLAARWDESASAVLMDVAAPDHLAAIGRMIWQNAQARRTLAVGASSVAQALIAHWRAIGEPDIAPLPWIELAAATGPVLVFAGSLSPVTARQVRAATSYLQVTIQPSQLMNAAESTAVQDRIVQALADGHHVLVTTVSGDAEHPRDLSTAADVAHTGAKFLRGVLDACASRGVPLRRLGIAGGDTSSRASQALGLWGLSYLGQLGPGVTVSRTHADDAALDGIELMLKGGQMGGEDVFERLLGGVRG
ncbi:MAG: four-carbon acid sugar kinase family protein [Pseudomonadota bacterium]